MSFVAAASLAWEGGNAEPGDPIDPKKVPSPIWERWIETGAVKETKK